MQVREVPPEEGEAINGGKPGPPPGDEEVARKSNLDWGKGVHVWYMFQQEGKRNKRYGN